MGTRRALLLVVGTTALLAVLVGISPRIWTTAGRSMLPGSPPGSRLLTLGTGVASVELGDLVVVRVDGVDVVKRVVSIGPSVVVLDENGLLPRARRHACPTRGRHCATETVGASTYEVTTLTAQAPARYRVSAGHVFLLGDARAASNDSRRYGAVSTSRVRGVVVFP